MLPAKVPSLQNRIIGMKHIAMDVIVRGSTDGEPLEQIDHNIPWQRHCWYSGYLYQTAEMEKVCPEPFQSRLQYDAEQYIPYGYASDLQDPIPTKLRGKMSCPASFDVLAQLRERTIEGQK